MEFFSIKIEETPTSRLINLDGDMRKYVPDFNDITSEKLNPFVEAYLAGDLKVCVCVCVRVCVNVYLRAWSVVPNQKLIYCCPLLISCFLFPSHHHSASLPPSLSPSVSIPRSLPLSPLPSLLPSVSLPLPLCLPPSLHSLISTRRTSLRTGTQTRSRCWWGRTLMKWSTTPPRASLWNSVSS